MDNAENKMKSGRVHGAIAIGSIELVKSVVTVLLCSVVGLLLLVVVFMLPDNSIQQNLHHSARTLERELDYPVIDTLNGPIKLDNYTDALMLAEAGSQLGSSLMDRVLSSYYFSVNGKSQFPSYLLYYYHPEDVEGERVPISYARYWHGYIFFLRPLLLFFRYYQIRKIYLISQGLLVIMACALLVYKRQKGLILPFLVSIYFLSPEAMAKSLQFSSVYFIALLSLCFLLLFYEKRWFEPVVLFTVIGCMTSYFDFLTAPILTLGYPLIVMLCLRGDRQTGSGVLNGCAWGIGYGGMWGLKWVYATLLTNQNIIQNGLSEIMAQTSFNDGVAFNYLDVIGRNWGFFCQSYKDYIILGVLLFYCMIRFVRNDHHGFKWTRVVFLILMMLLPFIWFLFASSHTFHHAFFTYRILSILPFSLGLLSTTVACPTCGDQTNSSTVRVKE